MMTDDAYRLNLEVQDVLEDPKTWPHPVEFPNSLALAALNSVYSLRGSSAAGRNVMQHYKKHRQEAGADPDYDDGTDLLDTITQAGGPEKFAKDVVRNSTKLGNTGRLKPEGLYEGVSTLVECDINTAHDLSQASLEQRDVLARKWQKTKGLGPASWDYLMMNVGIDDIKVDRMIRRFFERAVGNPSRRPSSQRIKAAFSEVAEQLGTTLRLLDHAIWNYESPHSRYK